jgi:hypothetical protein
VRGWDVPRVAVESFRDEDVYERVAVVVLVMIENVGFGLVKGAASLQTTYWPSAHISSPSPYPPSPSTWLASCSISFHEPTPALEHGLCASTPVIVPPLSKFA